MSPSINIEVNAAQRQEIEVLLREIPQGLARACSRALNKVATGTRAEIGDAVCRQTSLRPSDVRTHRVRLRLASLGNLWARVDVSGKRVPLIMFSARQTPRGVAYSLRAGSAQEVPGAFIRRGSGVRQVWAREYAAGGSGKRVGRYPLRMLRGPAVGQLVQGIEDFSQEALDRRAGEKLEAEISRQVQLALDGKAGYDGSSR